MTIRSPASSDIDGEMMERKRIYPERLTEKTLDGVAELEKLCFSQPWSKSSLELLTKEGIGVGMVCSSDGKICAYGGMIVAVDEGQITNIATHPDYRRRGYGRAVVESLIKYAKNNGLDSISLEVRESNKAAIELYTKLGFRVEGKRKDFYTRPVESALIMIWRSK